VWFALLVPDQIGALTPGAFVRIPVEALIVVGIALVLPDGARRVVAALGGVLLALLTIVKVFDMGFFEELDRPFNLVSDWATWARRSACSATQSATTPRSASW
jgi:hypothetical protein